MTVPRDGLTFPKSDRILRRSEFLLIQKQGRRLQAPHFVLILRDRSDGAGPRLGVTASKKAGNSVVRHRVRRLLREVFRIHREQFPAAHDFVVLVREGVPPLDFATVRDEVLGALTRTQKRSTPPSPNRPTSPNDRSHRTPPRMNRDPE